MTCLLGRDHGFQPVSLGGDDIGQFIGKVLAHALETHLHGFVKCFR